MFYRDFVNFLFEHDLYQLDIGGYSDRPGGVVVPQKSVEPYRSAVRGKSVARVSYALSALVSAVNYSYRINVITFAHAGSHGYREIIAVRDVAVHEISRQGRVAAFQPVARIGFRSKVCRTVYQTVSELVTVNFVHDVNFHVFRYVFINVRMVGIVVRHARIRDIVYGYTVDVNSRYVIPCVRLHTDTEIVSVRNSARIVAFSHRSVDKELRRSVYARGIESYFISKQRKLDCDIDVAAGDERIFAADVFARIGGNRFARPTAARERNLFSVDLKRRNVVVCLRAYDYARLVPVIDNSAAENRSSHRIRIGRESVFFGFVRTTYRRNSVERVRRKVQNRFVQHFVVLCKIGKRFPENDGKRFARTVFHSRHGCVFEFITAFGNERYYVLPSDGVLNRT